MFKNILLIRQIALISIISIMCVGIVSPQAKIHISTIDKTTQKVYIEIHLDKDDFIYKDYIDISVDNPDITISEWQSDRQTSDYFSKEFRETKKIYNTDFTITCNIQHTSVADITDSNIHLSYYLHSKKGLVEEVLSIGNRNDTPRYTECIETNIDTVKKTKIKTKETKKKQTWSVYISDMVKTTESLWVKILLSLLLGILLSLTPCIYPMIPITVGILQAQGSKSVFYNFLLALTYVIGISVTFALLGLLAAFTGQLFGAILANPIFIIILVLILIYLAFSMFGFYEIYIPKFLSQRGTTVSAKGTILSTFLFGVVSGTIASPCVSPGLVLLLSIVTAIGSKAIGFIMLFAFGLGLGFPLLIVGTFSGSINKLPKAGAWMMEIKKIFGIMMFGICFYFLGNILPWYIVLWMMSIFSLLTGMYYLFSVQPYDSKFWKIFKTILGTAFCAASIFIATKAYKEIYVTKITKADTFWAKDYKKALEIAKKENKKLFIDFWASWCSVCKAIDKKVFTDQQVKNIFSKKFINVKIDGTNPQDTQFVTLKKKFNVIGVPAFILLDPKEEKVIKRWTTQFYDLENQEIINEIQDL